MQKGQSGVAPHLEFVVDGSMSVKLWSLSASGHLCNNQQEPQQSSSITIDLSKVPQSDPCPAFRDVWPRGPSQRFVHASAVFPSQTATNSALTFTDVHPHP